MHVHVHAQTQLHPCTKESFMQYSTTTGLAAMLHRETTVLRGIGTAGTAAQPLEGAALTGDDRLGQRT